VLPVWLFWTVIAFWIVKDAVLFPFVWRAYDWDRSRRSQSMIAERGVAKEKLAPSGYVQIHGELWRAEKIGEGPPIEEGQPVRVKKMEGLTLFVVPEKTEDREQRTENRKQQAEVQIMNKFESPRFNIKLCYNLKCAVFSGPLASLTLSLIERKLRLPQL
jgi:hypothetical protein